MFTRRFTYMPDSDYGPGFAPAWMKNADPVGGFGAAHDFLEHLPNCPGGFEGEMMAFGGMHYVRGINFDWRSGTIETAQCSDLLTFYRAVHDGRQTLKEPPALPKYEKTTTGRWSQYERDTMRSEIVHFFVSTFKREVEDDLDFDCDMKDDEGTEPDFVTNAEVYADRIIGWMHIGFIRAANRYERRGLSRWDMGGLFREVHRLFDEAHLKVDHHNEDLVVGIDYTKKRVVVKRVPTVSHW